MKKKACLPVFILAISILTAMCTFGQTKNQFDLAAFTVPAGASENRTADKAVFTLINAQRNSYCLLAVYQSVDSRGSVQKDFLQAWEEIVRSNLDVKESPKPYVAQPVAGWQAKGGKAGYTDENKAKVEVILCTYTSGGKSISLMAVMSHPAHLTDARVLFRSLQLKKPVTTVTKNPPPPSPTVPGKGFQFSTTNFDDGWTSAVQPDWVEVKKGNVTVYLYYALPYNSDLFTGTGVTDRDYFWDNYVTRQFNVQSKQYNDAGEPTISLAPKYVEGWGTDRQTGERRFIGMFLGVSPNTGWMTVGTAPDEKSFRAAFPQANNKWGSDLQKMERFNYFAIAPADVLGKWQNGNTSTAQWYYESPSGYEGYAGMTLAATSASFQFNGNGTYTSIHNGATGAVGNMRTFQQEYKGKYTVENWKLSATNRYQGKTDQFQAYFKAIRGGRLLCLNDKAGQNYTLVRIK